MPIQLEKAACGCAMSRAKIVTHSKPCPLHVARKVMIAIDHGHESSEALRWAATNFLNSAQDEITLINVVDIPLAGPGYLINEDYETCYQNMDAQAKQASDFLLNKAIAEIHSLDENFKVSSISKQGDARDAILELVEELKPDTLIVGSHGFGIIHKALLGSVSHYLLNHANCNIIVCKDRKQRKHSVVDVTSGMIA